MVEVGDEAPGFTLQGVHDGEIRAYSLDELNDGAALVLGVYAYDFSPVCTDQVCSLDDMEWLTFRDGVNVVAASGDGPYSNMAFVEEHDISYPLLSDTDRSKCADYGVLLPEKDGSRSVFRRSLFLFGPDRQIERKWVAKDNWDDWDVAPIEEIRDGLEGLVG